MKLPILLFMLCYGWMSQAQNYDAFFNDATLRVDYIFAGNISNQHGFVHALSKTNTWHGRKGQLGSTPIQGDAQIRVYDFKTQKLIYVVPLGSLFQEWLTQPDAKTSLKSFKNSFLITLTKKEIKIEIVFFEKKGIKKDIFIPH